MYTYLKFGLPRVLPPSGRGRDGSSGYNSSDDGSPGPFKSRGGPTRARSELDFRNLNSHSSYHKVWMDLMKLAFIRGTLRCSLTRSRQGTMWGLTHSNIIIMHMYGHGEAVTFFIFRSVLNYCIKRGLSTFQIGNVRVTDSTSFAVNYWRQIKVYLVFK